jgi:hypothetical protein
LLTAAQRLYKQYGVQVASCDGEIEVYKIKVTTDTNLTENFCYTIGTNYNPSFSPQELKALLDQTLDLKGFNNIVTMGGFKFNMVDNKFILCIPIGSMGAYSSGLSGEGLWCAGTPNTISVTVQRIGYVTINNGSVTLHRDTLNEVAAVTANMHLW